MEAGRFRRLLSWYEDLVCDEFKRNHLYGILLPKMPFLGHWNMLQPPGAQFPERYGSPFMFWIVVLHGFLYFIFSNLLNLILSSSGLSITQIIYFCI